MPVSHFPRFDLIYESNLTITNADGTTTTYVYGTHQICIYSVWLTDKLISIVPGIFNTNSEETEPLPFKWEWEKGIEYGVYTYQDIRDIITNEGLATTPYSIFFNQLLWESTAVSGYFLQPE
jgi:hypothetical protein